MFYHRKLLQLSAITVFSSTLVITSFTGALFTKVGTAFADTPNDGEGVRTVVFRWQVAPTPPGEAPVAGFANPSPSIGANYVRMIRELRRAAGHQFVGGVPITQANRHGLIILDVRLPFASAQHSYYRSVQLIFRAQDMYLLGFITDNRQVYAFNSDLHFLRTRLDANHIEYQDIHSLGFNGGYTGAGNLENTASLHGSSPFNRQTVAITYTRLSSAFLNLSGVGPHRDSSQTAQQLLLAILWTSEAVRFREFEREMRNVMRTYDSNNPNNVYSLRLFDQHNRGRLIALTNSWDPISTYGESVAHPTNSILPTRILSQPLPRLHSFGEVALLVGILLNKHPRN